MASASEDDDEAALDGNTLRLFIHVLRRGYELGAFGGIVIGLPLLVRKRRVSPENSASPLLTAALRRLGTTSVYGAASTGEARFQSCFWLNGLSIHLLPSACAADQPTGLYVVRLVPYSLQHSSCLRCCRQYQRRVNGHVIRACRLCKSTIGLGIMHRYGAIQVLVWRP